MEKGNPISIILGIVFIWISLVSVFWIITALATGQLLLIVIGAVVLGLSVAKAVQNLSHFPAHGGPDSSVPTIQSRGKNTIHQARARRIRPSSGAANTSMHSENPYVSNGSYRFCDACGALVPSGAIRCEQCGKRL